MKNVLSGLIITRIHACNRIRLQPGTVSHRENRPLYAITIKTEGATLYHCGKRTYLSDPTHVCFLPKGAEYLFACQDAGECLMVEFDCMGAEDVRQPVSIEIGDNEELRKLFIQMEHALTFRREDYHLSCLSRMYRMLGIVVEQSTRRYLDHSKHALLAPAIEYIEQNLAQRTISNETLAAVCGISCVYFRKLFVQVCKVPPSTYIMTLRIRKAKGLLLGDSVSISDIAQQCGFASASHFSKAFKRVTGYTPRDYAKEQISRKEEQA